MFVRHVGSVLAYRDLAWWILAGLLGLWPPMARFLITGQMSHQAEFVIVHSVLFFGGVLLGFFRPDRFWCWSFASLLVVPGGDLLLRVAVPGPYPFSNHFAEYLLANASVYLLCATVVLVGSSLGAFLSR